MRLTDLRVRTDKWYMVGFSPVLEKYVLAITVGWLANYERYYEISRGEYEQTLTAAVERPPQRTVRLSILPRRPSARETIFRPSPP